MLMRIRSTRLNLHLYSLLLVITPFLLLQNYMQDAIGRLSRVKLPVGESGLPLFGLIAVAFGFLALAFLIKNFTKNRLIGLLLVTFLFWLGYSTSDYYFNHHFYDIQHNWHYFAYAIFSFLAWRYFNEKNIKAERIILNTFMLAFFLSFMDEIIQVFISNRVFDLSDVAKDLWGCMIGQVFIHFLIFDLKHLPKANFWQSGVKKWIKQPTYLLVVEFLFAWTFLNVASILSDAQYAMQVFLFTLAIFFFLAYLFQSFGKKTSRIFAIAVLAIFVLYPVGNLFLSKPRLTYVSEQIVLYKNIPIFYFDVMIYPNDMMRLVDKKTAFNQRDQQKINEYAPDILILATGSENQGGKGFDDQFQVEMVYNPHADKVYQLIKLPTEEACDKYNELIDQNKKVLMIIHNS